DLSNGRDYMLVVDHTAAVLAGKGRLGTRGQVDRDPHPLRPVALGAADADAAQHDQPADDHRVAIALRCHGRFHSLVAPARGGPGFLPGPSLVIEESGYP